MKLPFVHISDKVRKYGTPVVAVAFAALAGVMSIQLSSAATFAASEEAENGTVSGNAGAGDSVGASNNASVKFGLASTASDSSCPLPAYPSTRCTGVPSGTTLTTHTGDLEVYGDGQIVENMRVTGAIFVYGKNVIIRNTEAYAGVSNGFGGSAPSFTITDSTLGPPSGCGQNSAAGFSLGYGIGESDYTARRVYIRNVSDGIRDSGNNILVEDSFVKLCSTNPDDHSDGFQGYLGGTNVVLRHNTIDQRAVPAASQTAPIFVAGNSVDAHLYDNLLAGGTYTIRVYNAGGSYIVSGNRLVNNSWQFGPVDADCAAINWSNNSVVTIDSNYNVLTTVASQACKP